MPLTLAQAYSPARYRVRALFVGGGDPAGQSASAFTIRRRDGGPTLVRAVAAFAFDMGQLELALSEPLTPSVVYQLIWSSAVAEFSYLEAQTQALAGGLVDDPEAEIFGRDLAWLDGEPTADGDCPSRRGQACLLHDLPARALLRPGELVHLTSAGAALPDSVNGPMIDSDLRELAARLENEWRNDDRVADASVDVSADSDGAVNFGGQIQTVALGNTVRVEST